VVLTGGEYYPPTEYLSWLADAGFEDTEVLSFTSADANGVVIGRQPAGRS
jgi:beta-lactam-binding protein with PASTA domain